MIFVKLHKTINESITEHLISISNRWSFFAYENWVIKSCLKIITYYHVIFLNVKSYHEINISQLLPFPNYVLKN